jgi:hypothetical protein
VKQETIMNIRLLAGPAVAAALLGAAVAHAQVPPARVTDVGPPPAEERSSTGAIVLENSLVRAQRNNAFAESSARTGVTSVGRGVLRATTRAQAQAELADSRAAEAAEFYRRGAGSLTDK